ncbi:MAG: DUF1638 domain-containing protein [Granulosicoccaceae bacterium]
MHKSTLVIACGALSHELVALARANHWEHIDIQCLPAHWHNTPDKITPGVENKIIDNRDQFDRILVAYGDCGSGGQLDAMLAKYDDVERLPGAHCYSFFSGNQIFEQFSEDDIGTFYLTDYLAEHFDRLILEELGIAKHPELRDTYFGHYTHVLYLAQTEDQGKLEKAQAAADALGLTLKFHYTGLEPFKDALQGVKIVTA